MGISTNRKRMLQNPRRCRRRHGENVYELEAIPPNVMQTLLRDAIDSAIDVESFNVQGDRKKEDAAFLDGVRRMVKKTLESIPALQDK